MSTNQSSTSTVTTTSQGTSSSMLNVGSLSVYVPSTAAACMRYLNEVAENYSDVDLNINQQYLQEATVGSEIAHDKATQIKDEADDNFYAAEINAVGQGLGGIISICTAYSSYKVANPKEMDNANGFRKAIQDRIKAGPNPRFSNNAANEETKADADRRIDLCTGGDDGKVYGKAPITARDEDIIKRSSYKEAQEMLSSLKSYTNELNDQARTGIDIRTAAGNGVSSLIQGVTGAVAAVYTKDGAYKEADIAFDDASAKTNDEMQSGRNSEFNKIADIEMQLWQAEVQITQANKM